MSDERQIGHVQQAQRGRASHSSPIYVGYMDSLWFSTQVNNSLNADTRVWPESAHNPTTPTAHSVTGGCAQDKVSDEQYTCSSVIERTKLAGERDHLDLSLETTFSGREGSLIILPPLSNCDINFTCRSAPRFRPSGKLGGMYLLRRLNGTSSLCYCNEIQTRVWGWMRPRVHPESGERR